LSATIAQQGAADRRFVTDVFHSLSQPLTALQCSLELALAYDQTVEDFRASIEAALANSDRLRQRLCLQRELADASDPGERSEQSLLPELLEEVRQELLPLFESGNRRLLVICPQVLVGGERQKLARAFIYLLEYLQRQLAGGGQLVLSAAEFGDRARIAIEGAPPCVCLDTEAEQIAVARRTFEAAGGAFQPGHVDGTVWQIDLPLGGK